MFGKKENNVSDKTIISVKAYSGGVQEVSIEAQTVEKAYGLWLALRKELGIKETENKK